MTEAERQLQRALHYAIKGATTDIERFHFNTAISRLMELTNELYRYTGNRPQEEQNAQLLRETLEKFIIMISVFAPHLGEELWEMTGHPYSVFHQQWPQYDPKILEEQQVEYVIQVNGKIRDRMVIERSATEEQIREAALQTGRIPSLIQGKKIVKTVVVPHKLVNIVIRD